ncbi:MAG: S8/S53 family peptidase [Byssovorax sp.]
MAGQPQPGDIFDKDDKHWILIDSAKVCPAAAPWLSRHLFTPSLKGALGIDGILGTYCAYEWPATLGPLPDLSALPPGLPRAHDRRAITPQTNTVEGWAHATFVNGITRPVGLAPALADPRVRVIVADTEKDTGSGAGGAAGSNRHGELMADLVGELSCPPSGPCSVRVETRLALPRVRDPLQNIEATVTNRGDFGHFSDLVGAIDRSLVQWRADLQSGNPFPEVLALSLSVGFEKQDKVLPGDDFVADGIVLQALRAFSCHGGVIFAAAGNHGGQGSTGLLYPAAWQDKLQPTTAECETLISSNSYIALQEAYSAATGGQTPLIRIYHPNGGPETPGFLLHAIGAFDQGGVPIKKTRENACPRYGALGLGWSVDGAGKSLLTGTSVPTAVVSSFFAAAMAQNSFAAIQNPYLAAHPQTVLDKLAGLSPARSFGASGPCGDPWTCPEIPWIGGPTSEQPSLVQHNQSHFPLNDYAPGAQVDGGVAEDNNCTVEPLCEQKAASAIAALFPQPNDPPCTRGCYVDLTHFTFLINPAMSLTEVKLAIDSASAPRQLVDISAAGQTLTTGTPYTFKLATSVTIPSGARLSVSALTGTNNVSVGEQVLLIQ